MPALPVESKLLFMHVLIHSRLSYCNSVLTRLPWSLVQQLRSVLNSAARGDSVAPSHQTYWGLRSFAIAGPSSLNVSLVGLRSSFLV